MHIKYSFEIIPIVEFVLPFSVRDENISWPANLLSDIAQRKFKLNQWDWNCCVAADNQHF